MKNGFTDFERRGAVAFLLLFLLGTVVTGCGPSEDDTSERHGDATDVASEGGGEEETYSELFIDAMVELSVDMISITSAVETVAQADSVKDAVSATMTRLEGRLSYILENIDRLVRSDSTGFREPTDLMEAPELAPVVVSASQAMQKLNEENPSAAIRLQYHADEESEQVVELLDSLNYLYRLQASEEGE